MTTYYIQPNGTDGVDSSDTWDGLAPAYVSGTNGPWRTVPKIFSTLDTTGGHTIWLAPGVYRLASAITDSTSYSAKVYIKGDPDLAQSWDGSITEPGIVRITCTDSNNQPQAMDLFYLTAVNNLELWDSQLDGCTEASGYVLFENSTYQADTRLVRCVLLGGYSGALKVDCDECVALYQANISFGGTATSWPAMHRCFGMARTLSGTFSDCYADQCFSINACTGVAYYSNATAGTIPAGYVRNSVGFANYVFRAANAHSSGGPPIVNSLVHAQYGTRNIAVGAEMKSCYLLGCANDIYAADASDLSDSRRLYHGTSNATTPATAGHVPTMPPALVMLRAIMTAFGFEKFDDEDMVDNANVTTETYDINRRIMSVRYRGESASRKYPFPWAQSDRELSYDATKKNIVKLYRTSSEVLRIPIKKATATTISIQCDWSIDSGSTYPQIELLRENDGASMTSLGTDTIVGGDSQGHTLSIALTTGSVTDKDIVAVLVLKNRETTTNAYASFYGLTVT